MLDTREPVTLANVGGKVLEEKFADELNKVLQNITDLNTKPDNVRQVIIKLSFKPSRSRKETELAIDVDSKLAPQLPYESMGFIKPEQGRLTLTEYPPQTDLEDQIETNKQKLAGAAAINHREESGDNVKEVDFGRD
jgi:hypothetical protein